MRHVLQEWLVCLFTGQPCSKPNCKWKFIVSLIIRSKNEHKQPFKCTYLITRIRCPLLLSYCRFPALRSPFWQVLKIRFITHSEEDKGSSAAQCSPVHTARRKSSKKHLHVNPLAPNLCFTHIVRTFSFLKSFQRLSRGLKKTRNMTRKFRLSASLI